MNNAYDFLSIVEDNHQEVQETLQFLAEHATKYSVDKSSDGIQITATFPDNSRIMLSLDDAGYVEKVTVY